MKLSKMLRIEGKVQGVGYRESMLAEARRLGLTGWVRNRRDGSVEALVQGPAALLADIVAWSHRGPPHAVVTKVTDEEASGEDGLTEFERRDTV